MAGSRPAAPEGGGLAGKRSHDNLGSAHAGEAVAAGAAGLVYVRVGEGGAIDAAKPVREGLSDEQAAALLAATAAQPVRMLPSPPV